MKISSLRQAGGVNSLDNFARSWQRAVAFHEITPLRRPSVLVDDVDDHYPSGRPDQEHAIISHKSLLRQQFESAGGYDEYGPAIDDDLEDEPGRREGNRVEHRRLSSDINHDFLSHSALFPTSPGLSLGTSYGTVSSRIQESSRRRAAKLFHERHLAEAPQPDDQETEPLLVKQIENEDGMVMSVTVGQSTLPQTVCNSVNTLIGVGLLSLPLGIKYAGWVLGLSFLLFSAGATSYTAKLLAVCLDVDHSLLTYADIAYVSFGSRVRIATGFLFTFELLAASVALVVLFADSLDALVPGLGVTQWK